MAGLWAANSVGDDVEVYANEGRSEVLANPSDDHTAMVFDSTIRRHTDQFLFKFQKKN